MQTPYQNGETNSDWNINEFYLLNLKLDQNIQVKISKNIDTYDLIPAPTFLLGLSTVKWKWRCWSPSIVLVPLIQ